MTLMQDHISVAAVQQQRILARLAKTDAARASLEQSNKYISDIQSQILKFSDQIKLLAETTVKDEHAAEKYHEGAWRKLAYHMSGPKEKFESRAREEEGEYIEAMQHEKKARDKLDKLKHDLAVESEEKRKIETAARENIQAQAELDRLYDSIFGGSTPGFPQEDKKEAAVKVAKTAYDDAQTKFDAEQRVVKVLCDARDAIHEALHNTERALEQSRSDGSELAHSVEEHREKNPLSKAQSAAAKTEMLMKRAQRMNPKVESIGPMRIAQNSMVTVFDNPWDMGSFRQKLEKADTELRYASAGLSGQLSAAKRRAQELKQDVDKEKANLENARSELQDSRAEAFKRILAGRK